ncbi:MAG: 3-oxo-5-alpha-steroid 4-dehydrogenase, partial [Muribaculaceae bacterium]|nr:3-oxo-5-alpha-steroid 4-dehydrogenase [Muribaculaceae bacterium]
METIFTPSVYYTIVWTMIGMALVVFLVLQNITAGYGMMYDRRWGPTVGNRLGWVLMEAPVFFAMLLLWLLSDRKTEIAPAVMGSLFLFHYFQRSFIFPLLIKGKGRMPFSIILMGVIFNLVNAYMIGGWIFYVAPEGMYTPEWLTTPQFIIGTVIFFLGMGINLHSDHIIRTLRKPGDTRHYI